jgi:hypothetical protein
MHFSANLPDKFYLARSNNVDIRCYPRNIGEKKFEQITLTEVIASPVSIAFQKYISARRTSGLETRSMLEWMLARSNE